MNLRDLLFSFLRREQNDWHWYPPELPAAMLAAGAWTEAEALRAARHTTGYLGLLA